MKKISVTIQVGTPRCGVPARVQRAELANQRRTYPRLRRRTRRGQRSALFLPEHLQIFWTSLWSKDDAATAAQASPPAGAWGVDAPSLLLGRETRPKPAAGDGCATRGRATLIALIVFAAFCARECGAWDYPTHRVINQLALDSLPGDFPAFALTPEARERIAFLGGEADRWRNTSDLNHLNAPEHYFDVEEVALYGLDVHALTPFRYEFTAQLALARAAHPDRVPAIDLDQDRAHVRQLVGFLPWAIMENFDKLKSGFSYLKAYEDGGGTSDEIANARQNIIYVMGVMSHYVADASQPLHMTVHYNGWTGPNPNGYTTAKTIHAWIDGGYFQQIGGLKLKDLASGLHPAHTVPASETFQQICHYLLDQQKQVEPLYKLEKAGKLSGEGEHGLEGKEFLQRQVLVGGQMLGNLWYSAWKQAGPDNLLRSQLARRKFANDPAPGK